MIREVLKAPVDHSPEEEEDEVLPDDFQFDPSNSLGLRDLVLR